MRDSTAAQLIALAILLAISALLALIRRTVAVATAGTTYTATAGVSHTVHAGQIIPMADIPLLPAGSYSLKTLSLLRSLVVGEDNRTSTSKTVMFAWTYAIAFGLISIITAKWLGSGTGYDNLVKNGLRQEYWLFLGGSYAAAVLAKYTASAQGQGGGKTIAGVGDASPTQLVANDQGHADLG